MELSSTQFNPLSVVEGVAEILVPQAAAKNLLLLATVDRAIPDTVYGDPLRLRQVLLNLCGNAVKFTDQGQIILKVELCVTKPATDAINYALLSHRQWHWYIKSLSKTTLRAIHAGRRRGLSQHWRHRFGPEHLETPG
jgi:signal transduction histidine kinase